MTPPEIQEKINRANITLLGSFNPAILVPNWLAKQGILQPDSQVSVFFQFGGGGEGFPIHLCEDLDVGWLVTHDKLVMFGDLSRCGDFLKQIFSRLEHTPVNAAGVNFQTKQSEHLSHSQALPSLFQRLAQLGKTLESGFSVSVQAPVGFNATVRLTQRGQEQLVDYNFHINNHEWARILEHVTNIDKFSSVIQEVEGTNVQSV